MDITIIGSFRKYYSEICNAIQLLEINSIRVLSPKRSYVTKKIGDFVILASDQQDLEPYIIQENVFSNITNSSFVYVWNPGGYLGNSTCYEIGKVMMMNIPIYYKEFPKDLPIKVDYSMVKSLEDIIEMAKKKE